ncbi:MULTISPECIES: sigma factor [Clostridium]|uniref:sigma factor n=1 Tax=Clostridium TaxID=1485 RepID=UPI0006C52155|nr:MULTISPECIES: sigma factor [Clostridium]MDU1309090.1 sigma factor [Clostridium sp.]MDU1408028.1 sigma factor [Clostridium sp.]MDU7214307.1 sigma factor [Clostridium sp.]CUN52581.1 RNA polymerase sigma factor [Clostridium paraputrificum]CUQ20065.1 RNA polymerase sigma factor [Clostridium paraputrificum]
MKIDEKNYLKQLCNKNEKALEYVIDNYSAIVNVVIRNVLRSFENEGLIEECISDVFFSALDNIHKFKGDDNNFKNWIDGINKYKAIDYYRKYSHEKYRTSDIENHVIQDKILIGNI